MRRFNEVGVEIVVGKYRTAHRRHADGLIQHAHFFQHFRHKPVRDAVGTTGAIVGRGIGKAFRSFINQVIWSCYHIFLMKRGAKSSRSIPEGDQTSHSVISSQPFSRTTHRAG